MARKRKRKMSEVSYFEAPSRNQGYYPMRRLSLPHKSFAKKTSDGRLQIRAK
jgi:hypothetical protein